jgi:hypothetical protein
MRGACTANRRRQFLTRYFVRRDSRGALEGKTRSFASQPGAGQRYARDSVSHVEQLIRRDAPRKRGIQYAVTVVVVRDASGYWIARSSRATTPREDKLPHSRGTFRARVMHRVVPRSTRGHRECRCDVRTRSLACKIKKHASKSPQARRNIRHSLRNGFTASFVLSSGIGLFCPRHHQEALAS